MIADIGKWHPAVTSMILQIIDPWYPWLICLPLDLNVATTFRASSIQRVMALQHDCLELAHDPTHQEFECTWLLWFCWFCWFCFQCGIMWFKGLCNLSMLQRKNVVRSGNSISAVELEQFWQWHRHVTSNVESSLADGPTMLVPLCTSRARYPHPPQLIEGWFLKIFRLAILCGIPNVEIKFERHQWSKIIIDPNISGEFYLFYASAQWWLTSSQQYRLWQDDNRCHSRSTSWNITTNLRDFFWKQDDQVNGLFANSWWFDGHFTWLLWDITTYHGTVLLCFKRPGTQKLCRIAPKKSLQTSPCVEKLRAAPPWPIWHWLHLGDLWVIIGFRELNGFDGSQEIPLFVARKCGFLPIVHIIIQWVIALVVWLTQLSLSPKGPCKKVLPGTGYLLASAPGWITTHRVVLILRGLGLLGPAEKVEDMNDWKRLVRMCGNASRASWSLVPKFIKILKFAFDHVCFMSVSILKPGCPALLPTSTINFSPRNGCCRWTISSCSGHPEDRCRLGRFPCFPVLPLFLVRGRLCHGVPMVRWAMWWLAIAAPFHVQMVLMGSLSGNIHRCPQRCLPCE